MLWRPAGRCGSSGRPARAADERLGPGYLGGLWRRCGAPQAGGCRSHLCPDLACKIVIAAAAQSQRRRFVDGVGRPLGGGEPAIPPPPEPVGLPFHTGRLRAHQLMRGRVGRGNRSAMPSGHLSRVLPSEVHSGSDSAAADRRVALPAIRVDSRRSLVNTKRWLGAESGQVGFERERS
jgi:hypothetical protein